MRGDKILTRLGHGHQVGADPLELGAGHGDGGSVFSLGNTKVLLVDIHKLEVVLGNAVVVGALEDEVERVGGVVGLEGEHVLVLGSAQDLGERDQVDTESDVAVASVGREGLGLVHHGDEGHVRVVHGLEGEARVIAVEVAVLNQVLDGIDDLGNGLSALNARRAWFICCSSSPSSGRWPSQVVPQAWWRSVNWIWWEIMV